LLVGAITSTSNSDTQRARSDAWLGRKKGGSRKAVSATKVRVQGRGGEEKRTQTSRQMK
jgi:hypothetical protein